MNKKAFAAFVLCLFFTPLGLFFISLQGIRHAAGAPDLFLRCTWEWIGCAQAVRLRVPGRIFGCMAARPWVNTRLRGCALVAAIAAPRRYGCASQGEYPAAWLHTRSGDSCAQVVRLRVPGEYPAVRFPARAAGYLQYQ